MLGTNDPGGLPNRGRGNSVAAAKECGVKGKESQERLGSTDVTSGGDKDETIVHGDMEPPVTKKLLSELDLPQILASVKFRHELNFVETPLVHPDLDSEKGRQKAQRAGEFWDCLRSQLQAFMEDKAAFEIPRGLTITLKEIGEILWTLVPPED